MAGKILIDPRLTTMYVHFPDAHDPYGGEFKEYVEKILAVPVYVSADLSDEQALEYVNERLAGRGGWLQIGNEPKQDTWFLACWSYNQAIEIVRHEDPTPYVYNTRHQKCEIPTHWMPLPTPVREKEDAKAPTV